MPSTPFIGVRISWLMFARNSDLSRDASSAWSRAWASSRSLRLRSVMSWTKALNVHDASACAAVTASSTVNVLPARSIASTSTRWLMI